MNNIDNPLSEYQPPSKEALRNFGIDISVDAVNEYAKSILGRYPKNNYEFSRALETKILEETKSLANNVEK